MISSHVGPNEGRWSAQNTISDVEVVRETSKW